MKGFYVPNSISSSYVANKRNEQGSFQYDAAANAVGLEKQAALQTLGKNYATTIENAYSSYLSANRGVMGSNMGQGYKEAYLEAQQQELNAEIANANVNLANARAELNQQESEARAQIDKAFQQEVSNFDRVAKSMQDYLSYVKSLTSADGTSTYLPIEDYEKSVDDLYEVLFNAQPQGYLDAEGNMGQSFVQWVNSQLKDTSADTAWSQWLFGQGGYQEFLEAARRGK